MKTTDVAMGAFEAKNKFSELLERVGRGAEFTITKHDRPVARLVPAQEGRRGPSRFARPLQPQGSFCARPDR